jgi:phosphatidylserine decarboxylase
MLRTLQKFVSHLAGLLANSQWAPLKNCLIRWLIKHFQISLDDCVRQSITDYRSANDFFTRTLKPDARPFIRDQQTICSPADGAISEVGTLLHDRLVQIKGQYYTLADLLNNAASSTQYYDGSFMTIYLAPYNYHRVHMPITGRLKKMVYVPGKLFSVNKKSVAKVPRLFCRNERVLFLFDSEHGEFAVIMVGALLVGSIASSWGGVVTHSDDNLDLHLEKGAELGCFQFGSTVIMLFPPSFATLNPELTADTMLVLGQRVGTLS